MICCFRASETQPFMHSPKMSARPKLRVPLFDREWLFNIYEEPEVASDEAVERWLAADWTPAQDYPAVGPREDPAALREVLRLMKFRTCAFCRTPMTQVSLEYDLGKLLVCTGCNYWGGRGKRPHPTSVERGLLGRYSFITNPDRVPVERLLSHFRSHPTDLLSLSPRKAESIVVAILKEALDCDVVLVGGVKDNGIDALIHGADGTKTIVQVKWRESSQKSESVSVVREVGGTILARGVPRAIVISTRKQFSPAARKEAELISQRELVGAGKLDMTLKNFNDMIDMLEVATRHIGERLQPQDLIPDFHPWRMFGMP
jgi:hypothetical protein